MGRVTPSISIGSALSQSGSACLGGSSGGGALQEQDVGDDRRAFAFERIRRKAYSGEKSALEPR